ncbi:MAG: effector-associated domain EAD1-containing protein [Xenococcaceae cyanobacterium]
MPSEDNIPRIFICYAHKDNESDDPSKRWLDRLLEYLKPLNLQDQVNIWSDEKLKIGELWHEEIQDTLKQVNAAVLLVSPAFMASKYIRNSEVPVLLKNAKDRGVVILPIILRKSLFQETKFKYPDPQDGPDELSLSVFQTANPPSKPLNSLDEDEQDEVFLSVARRLLQIVNSSQERANPPNVSNPVIANTSSADRTAEISNLLELTGSEIEEFQEAIRSAYSEAELKRLLRTKLNIKYDDIAQGNTYQDRVFNLIENFEREGQLREFLEAAFKGKPTSPKLRQFYQAVIN